MHDIIARVNCQLRVDLKYIRAPALEKLAVLQFLSTSPRGPAAFREHSLTSFLVTCRKLVSRATKVPYVVIL
jgi:hypothetical protein